MEPNFSLSPSSVASENSQPLPGDLWRHCRGLGKEILMPYPINQSWREQIELNWICARVGLWDTALKFLSPGPRNDVTDHLVVSPRNDIWESSAEISYWWRVTDQILNFFCYICSLKLWRLLWASVVQQAIDNWPLLIRTETSILPLLNTLALQRGFSNWVSKSFSLWQCMYMR